jgi:hypothetical protein
MLDMTASQVINVGILEDGIKPGPDMFTVLKALFVFQGLVTGFLDQVAGIFPVIG